MQFIYGALWFGASQHLEKVHYYVEYKVMASVFGQNSIKLN